MQGHLRLKRSDDSSVSLQANSGVSQNWDADEDILYGPQKMAHEVAERPGRKDFKDTQWRRYCTNSNVWKRNIHDEVITRRFHASSSKDRKDDQAVASQACDKYCPKKNGGNQNVGLSEWVSVFLRLGETSLVWDISRAWRCTWFTSSRKGSLTRCSIHFQLPDLCQKKPTNF